jgi:aspartyl aminopeptidase
MYHATSTIISRLLAAGFEMLSEADSWKLRAGGRYFVARNHSAVIAFIVGSSPPWEGGFSMAGSHTDSPGLKLRPDTIQRAAGCLRVGVEVYGGPILATWMDREYSLGGLAMVDIEGQLVPRLFDLQRPVAVVPNPAIHMQKNINEGFQYNRHQHLQAVFGPVAAGAEKTALAGLIAEALGVASEQIRGFDAFLHDAHGPSLVGIDEAMIVSGRLDNLAMCHAILHALLRSQETSATRVALFMDNEEVGSQTRQGADSSFMETLLHRVTAALGGERDAFWRSMARSFMVSADMAHAAHPNFPEFHDAGYSPVINGGPVVKFSANYRYATTSESAAEFERWCRQAEVPSQRMLNRSDMPPGSTIGPMSSARLGVAAVDVGNPMWAMHSVRETAGVMDQWYMTRFLTTFFSAPARQVAVTES